MRPATHPRRVSGPPARQRGVTALFVTLIVMLVMMILAITAALLSGTQFKLSGNLQQENIAFNLAESALAQGQDWLSTPGNYKDTRFDDPASCTSRAASPYYPSACAPPDPYTGAWNDTNSCAVKADGTCASSATSTEDTQRYRIQKIAGCQAQLGSSANKGGRMSTAIERADIFRVTVRGTAGKGTSKVIQTTFLISIPAKDAPDRCGS